MPTQRRKKETPVYDGANPIPPPAPESHGHNGHHGYHDGAGAAERLAAAVGGATLLRLAGRQRGRWLGVGMALAGAPLVYRGLTGRWPVTRAFAARAAAPLEVEATVTIARPAEDLYTFWRKLENLPRFMHGLESVTENGSLSHWVGHSVLGLRPTWDAEIVEDLPGRLLSWRSVPGAQVHNAGVVLFEPTGDDRETVVRIIMELVPYGAAFGRAVGRALTAGTAQQVREDLRRFKCLMEAGEVPVVDGQTAGARSTFDLHNPF
jgi:uncharacterized membrane protein